MTKLTDKQISVLQGLASGSCGPRNVWKWTVDGEPCTREVTALVKRGLAECQYYSDGRAGCNPTDAGRATLAEIGRAAA